VTVAWLAIYVLVPALMATLLVRQARTPGADPPRTIGLPGWLCAVLAAQAAVLLGAGIALFAAPAQAAPLWPWHLTPMLAQATGAWLIALGVASAHVIAERDPRRLRPAAAGSIALPVLLAADWLAKKESRQDEILFRSMAAILIALLFVIMVSAFERMFLYLAEYGQTELRTYTTAFMVWLAILLFWFAATVLRGRRDRFAFGAMISGLAMILVLHLANPDATIVRTNACRAARGLSFDVAYNTSLSADSVPELVKDIGLLRSDDQARVARSLLNNWSAPKGDWRTWNNDRAAAVRSVQASRTLLEKLAAGTPGSLALRELGRTVESH